MRGDRRHRPTVVDTFHRILANRRRRQIVRILNERDGGATLEELVARLRDLDDRDAGRHGDATIEYDGEERIALTDLGNTLARVERLVGGAIEGRRVE